MAMRVERSAAEMVGLVLAAGDSSRMGADTNKLLESIGGRPLVAVPVDALLAAGLSRVVVVTGHAEDELREALLGRAVEFVHHAGWVEGMGASLAAGVRALGADPAASGLVVTVGDLPRARAETVSRLVDAFLGLDDRDAIVVPTHAGDRGHPVVFGSDHFAALSRLSGDRGGRSILEAKAQAVVELPVDDPGIRLDIDTPEALAGARAAVRQEGEA